MNYSYPGNVRELENIVERFCLLGGDVASLFTEKTGAADLLPAGVTCDELLSRSNPLKTAAQSAKEQAEKNLILHTLKIHGNNYPKTAQKLKISRAYLYEKVKKYGITKL
jgi:transcriptional regulator with PAS, ATPase and Fis domain